MSHDFKILVTGATGFLGRHIVPALQSELKAEIIGVGRKDFDLLQQGQAEAMLENVEARCGDSPRRARRRNHREQEIPGGLFLRATSSSTR